MKYVCLVHVDGAAMAALTPEEEKRLVDATIEEDWALRRRGQLILGQPLQSPETAVIVRVRDGRRAVTDGPYAETKEHLGGFFIIEARDLNEAIDIAASSPMAALGSIEVRPSLEQAHSATGETRPPVEAG